MEQSDWIKVQDRLAEYKRSLRAAVQRRTMKVAAGELRIDPTTLGHQLEDWNKRKQPSALCAVLQLWSDEQHQHEVLGQVGKLVIRPPRMSAADAIRAAVHMGRKGYVSQQELAELLAQTDLGAEP